jgi:hypothetical protein
MFGLHRRDEHCDEIPRRGAIESYTLTLKPRVSFGPQESSHAKADS